MSPKGECRVWSVVMSRLEDGPSCCALLDVPWSGRYPNWHFSAPAAPKLSAVRCVVEPKKNSMATRFCRRSVGGQARRRAKIADTSGFHGYMFASSEHSTGRPRHGPISDITKLDMATCPHSAPARFASRWAAITCARHGSELFLIARI